MGLLLFIIPALMGGCPEFRNNVVNIANEATQSVIIGGEDQNAAWDNVVRGLLSATIDLFFDQLRTDTVSR
jgi:hypothetical protein